MLDYSDLYGNSFHYSKLKQTFLGILILRIQLSKLDSNLSICTYVDEDICYSYILIFMLICR